MVDFVALAAVARRLIEENGRDITLVRLNRDPSDSAKPWRGPDRPIDSLAGGLSIASVRAAFVPPRGTGLGLDLMEADGQRSLDQICLLATDSVVAAGGTAADVEEVDRVIDGGTTWYVEAVEHLAPASTSVIFALGLRS